MNDAFRAYERSSRVVCAHRATVVRCRPAGDAKEQPNTAYSQAFSRKCRAVFHAFQIMGARAAQDPASTPLLVSTPLPTSAARHQRAGVANTVNAPPASCLNLPHRLTHNGRIPGRQPVSAGATTIPSSAIPSRSARWTTRPQTSGCAAQLMYPRRPASASRVRDYHPLRGP